MNYLTESFRHLFGLDPSKPRPGDRHQEVVTLMEEKRRDKLTKGMLHAAEAGRALAADRHKWRNRRWATLITLNLIFVVSYYFDVQLLEGALTASRFVGFHLADLNSALQVMLAYRNIVLNLVIGTLTLLVLWLLLGGRTFCSWVCPYHLLAEWAEQLHLWLVKRKWARDIRFHRTVRTICYVLFLLLTLLSGYTLFETLSPTGILSRALIYGPGLALIWVLALLAFEILFSRRAWCRYVCPIGVTYGLVGLFSPVRVQYRVQDCHHEGDCRAICLVPHVLDVTIRGRARAVTTDIGADCTRCGLCIDICPTNSLGFTVKGLDKLL